MDFLFLMIGIVYYIEDLMWVIFWPTLASFVVVTLTSEFRFRLIIVLYARLVYYGFPAFVSRRANGNSVWFVYSMSVNNFLPLFQGDLSFIHSSIVRFME